MTQEEKQLLIKDLSARLPYGVKISTSHYRYGDISIPKGIVGDRCYFNDNPRYDGDCPIEEVKPYLRPLSSMTKEERKYFWDNGGVLTFANVLDDTWEVDKLTVELLDWLNEHYFDYRGLIEKGLALEAPEGMYKNK